MKRISFNTSEYKATITFEDGSNLEVDFEAIVNEFKLNKLKSYVLCHWQSRPKGLRGYGFYDSTSKTYNCIDWNSVTISKCFIRTLQLDELVHVSSVPTAVLLFPNVRLKRINTDNWIIT
ncbi:hypothetical protein H6G54_00800 [Anabaena cylindrica FACHB-243]|uniref:Uncharacterized protein n=1 Tax=Anabaena cylindrica (strain ATCC 27899 / PCC 7122) TaxID=272123 RepID=K9ZJJ8_ANACC|nr:MULTISPECIES: hypothetical protein [Anabaena]AFZ59381.1 hypothetical protein Anacy_4011 [Anabaena cylindrica PCC 7122]MBD2416275.1 hypothetical protein [Anabaena cylindrica FACHB-243]MBY5280237.1 hypothetical protein [Anabaena sp. CCAP 1446/1C]MBY5308509.1 hypothetical protein [Anabaena sp. CCAP 1446/1C]MCM2405299.1 hypothetical protein [Anabaena sp. CCAP 1446/1C]